MATAEPLKVDSSPNEVIENEYHVAPDSNPLTDVSRGTSSSSESHRRTKIKTSVDMAEISGSENSKPYNPEIEQTLLKNQEMLTKRASSEASGKGSVLEMVVPRTVFLFKKLRPKKLINWSSKPLRFPLSQVNEINSKAALRSFECIQRYMGDRAIGHEGKGDILEIRYICDKGLCGLALRNELYLQVYKQLNMNPNINSVAKGWEILCVLTNCFLPSEPLSSAIVELFEKQALSLQELDGILINNKLNDMKGEEKTKMSIRMMATYCLKRFRVLQHGTSKGRVPTVEEIKYYIRAPFRYNVFGEELSNIMKNPQHVDASGKLPKVLSFLSEAVLLLKGHDCEGIFRVPGDLDSVIRLKMRIERGEYNLEGIQDPAVPASLLKLWVRELAVPVIPHSFYQRCLQTKDVQSAMDIVDQLPLLNRNIIKYLAKFLQVVGNPQHQPKTKMTVSNLAMVFAPNILRCPSDNPLDILRATKDEQHFVKIIINYLDE